MVGMHEVFKDELALITTEDIRSFTSKALDILPPYFWTMPASTTGKYHPASSLGEGGLVRHTKTALKIAEVLFRFATLGDYSALQKDCIRSALVLHDGVKKGPTSAYTVHEHPLLVCELIRNNEEVYNTVEPKVAEAILAGIASHMSSWNTDKRSKVVLPLPEKPYQVFIALCDYLSAQKIFNIAVDGWENPNMLTDDDKAIISQMGEVFIPQDETDCEKFASLMKKVEGEVENEV